MHSSALQDQVPTQGQGGEAITGDATFAVDHWEIFGRDRQQHLRGWFACHDAKFAPAKTDHLHLSLQTPQDNRIEVEIEITVTFKAAEL
jgi:hypothetical protein